jgi:hypothetical protein
LVALNLTGHLLLYLIQRIVGFQLKEVRTEANVIKKKIGEAKKVCNHDPNQKKNTIIFLFLQLITFVACGCPNEFEFFYGFLYTGEEGT